MSNRTSETASDVRSTSADEIALTNHLDNLEWTNEGVVFLLVAKPAPGVHEVVPSVTVHEGVGFETDHERKSYYRGVLMPGRQVSAVSVEVCAAFGVDAATIGDNLVTKHIDLKGLVAGTQILVGRDLILERTNIPHRPCLLFAERAGSVAYNVARLHDQRGALFNVVRTGIAKVGDKITVVAC